MLTWLPLASFPSNEPNTPSSFVALVTAALLVGLLLWIAQRRKFVGGLVIGAVAFAVTSGALFWPRVLREPYAPNPGPFLVFLGAITGGCLGAMSALMGKALHALFPRSRSQSSDESAGESAESRGIDGTKAYCSYCRKEVAIESDYRCLECRWPVEA